MTGVEAQLGYCGFPSKTDSRPHKLTGDGSKSKADRAWTFVPSQISTAAIC